MTDKAAKRTGAVPPGVPTGVNDTVGIDTDVNTLLGMISHELRTPIQTILANVEVLGLLSLPPDAELALDRVFRSINVALRRLDSISQYVRSSTDPAVPCVAGVVVDQLLQDLVHESASEAEKLGQRLTIQNNDAPSSIATDVDRLHQVLTNYVVNAIRHGDEGGEIVIRASRAHMSGSSRDALEFSVTNAGDDVPPPIRETIWQPFVRSGGGGKRVKGMGLGLAVVGMLASAAAWEVGLRNEREGTLTFYVRVPLQDSALA